MTLMAFFMTLTFLLLSLHFDYFAIDRKNSFARS